MANFVKIKQSTQLLPIMREIGMLLDAGIKARVLLTIITLALTLKKQLA